MMASARNRGLATHDHRKRQLPPATPGRLQTHGRFLPPARFPSNLDLRPRGTGRQSQHAFSDPCSETKSVGLQREISRLVRGDRRNCDRRSTKALATRPRHAARLYVQRDRCRDSQPERRSCETPGRHPLQTLRHHRQHRSGSPRPLQSASHGSAKVI